VIMGSLAMQMYSPISYLMFVNPGSPAKNGIPNQDSTTSGLGTWAGGPYIRTNPFFGCPIHVVSSHEWAIRAKLEPLLCTAGLQAWPSSSPTKGLQDGWPTFGKSVTHLRLSLISVKVGHRAKARPEHHRLAIAQPAGLSRRLHLDWACCFREEPS
jgi:hypothetical protein